MIVFDTEPDIRVLWKTLHALMYFVISKNCNILYCVTVYIPYIMKLWGFFLGNQNVLSLQYLCTKYLKQYLLLGNKRVALLIKANLFKHYCMSMQFFSLCVLKDKDGQSKYKVKRIWNEYVRKKHQLWENM